MGVGGICGSTYSSSIVRDNRDKVETIKLLEDELGNFMDDLPRL